MYGTELKTHMDMHGMDAHVRTCGKKHVQESEKKITMSQIR